MLNEKPRVGVGVLVVRGDHFLLGKRCGAHMNGFYAAPGGHLETGETFVTCAIREVEEETGLRVSDVRFLMIGNYILGTKHYADIDMVAISLEGEPVTREPEKCEEWQWFHKNNLPEPLFIVTKRMIEAYLNNFHADEKAISELLSQ